MAQATALLAFHETRATLNQLNVNLGGAKGRQTLRDLKKFNRGENPFPPKPKTPTTIRLPRSYRFNPVEFLGKGWFIDDEDQATADLEEFDIARIKLDTSWLNDNETTLKGETKIECLQAADKLCLGADHFRYFWEHQDKIPEEWKKINAVYFDGTRVRRSDGYRCVLCLYWNAGRWCRDYSWLKHDCDATTPSAVLDS